MVHIGIIGLGAIGQRLIKQFIQHKEIEIVAICDIQESIVEETANIIGHVNTYTDYQQLIGDETVDLVYVAVPPKYHFPIVMDVLNAQKHVLCEKPLANSQEEAAQMYQRAKEANVVHAMNFPLNYESAATTFSELIKQNYIGRLRRLQLTMHFPQWPRHWQQNNWVGGREQGGFVLEVGVHFIQQILKTFGDITNIQTKLELPTDLEKCESGVIATAELSDGTPILIEGLSDIPGKEYIGFTAYGAEGVLSLENWSQLKGGRIGEELQEIPTNHQPNQFINELIKAVHGEIAEIYDFGVGYKAQEVLEKLIKN